MSFSTRLRSLGSYILGENKGHPALPEGLRVYAVGDIHGCMRQLDRLRELIAEDARSAGAEKSIVYLGDYVDRGPDSRGVIERLLQPLPGFHSVHLRGNHDQTFMDFLHDPLCYLEWKGFGAPETLMSYGVLPPRFENDEALTQARDELLHAMPPAHRRFFETLSYSVTYGDYFFTHAGVRPGLGLDKQVPEDLMWIREDFLNSGVDFGKIIVHGHTPMEEPQIRPNRIGIDTGVYFTGKLTALVLEGQARRFLSAGTDI
jgi:serine/threonine protein phosphatase 1